MKDKKHKKLSLAEYAWFGFNFMFAITFVSTFSAFANYSNDTSGIGLNVLWIWLLEGLIAGSCAWAFAKLSKYHHMQNSNGSSYLFTRTNLGKKTGILIGFVHYIYLPISVTYQLMQLVRALFSYEMVNTAGDAPWYTIYFGGFTDLGLDLISIGIFFLCVMFVFFGINLYKKIVHASAMVKWIGFMFLILLAIVLACQNGGKNLNTWSQHSTVNLDNFSKTFNSCFFCFIGFETFSTFGHNVKDGHKNVSKGIVISVGMSIIIFTFLTFIFFCGFDKFADNFNMGAWDFAKGQENAGMKMLYFGGPIITIMSILAMRVNTSMQKALYGGTTLQPLAKEGFFPTRLSDLDEHGIPKKASKFNLIILGMMFTLWLIIPDIIKGAMCSSAIGVFPDKETYMDWANLNKIFDLSSLSSFASIVAITIYVSVIIVAIKLIINKKVKSNIIEMIMFPATMVFLIFLFGYHFYALISNNLINSNGAFNKITSACIEFIFLFIFISFFFTWYSTYYKRVYNNRIKTNPELQAQLNSQFVLINT